MWIKAPAKQLAQSSALASLTGLSEYPFFCHRWGGKENIFNLSRGASGNVWKAVSTETPNTQPNFDWIVEDWLE